MEKRVMAKFLIYEDRLEIEGSLKVQMTFIEIGKNQEEIGQLLAKR